MFPLLIKEQEFAFYFLWLVHVVGFGMVRDLTHSKSIVDHNRISPEKHAPQVVARFSRRQLINY
jgi:hypothetical protein